MQGGERRSDLPITLHYNSESKEKTISKVQKWPLTFDISGLDSFGLVSLLNQGKAILFVNKYLLMLLTTGRWFSLVLSAWWWRETRGAFAAVWGEEHVSWGGVTGQRLGHGCCGAWDFSVMWESQWGDYGCPCVYLSLTHKEQNKEV